MTNPRRNRPALRFAVFASGRGTNANALMDAFTTGFIAADLALVLCNRPNADVLSHAESRGYPTVLVDHQGMTRQAHEAELLDVLRQHRIEHILLAGYMRILTPTFLEAFAGRVINIHPSLLPDYPGLHAVQRQWSDGVSIAGATVHFVDEGVDTGEPLLQGSFVVRGDEGEDGLQQRILNEVEHIIYPRAVRLFIDRCQRQHTAHRPAAAAKDIIMRALLSVYDKTGIIEFARGLVDAGYALVSSGGTAKALGEAGIEVTAVEAYTGAPEVLGGRVKTLHPKIHAGILADRSNPAHLRDLSDNGYEPIDLVVCNLYPFAETRAQTSDRAALIEKIDVGGPSMLRAAAKNVDGGVTVICEASDYGAVLSEVNSGGISKATRQRLMAKAFSHCMEYDAEICAWLGSLQAEVRGGTAPTTPPAEVGRFKRTATLRYGENPDQAAALYSGPPGSGGVAQGQFVGGKALSYNNYLDLDGALRCATDMAVHAPGQHCCAIIKHTNPCGLAIRDSQKSAFEAALAGDPMSAFGSVIGFNAAMQEDTAQALGDSKLFVECLVAPDFAPGARQVLAKKKNLRWLKATPPSGGWTSHHVGGGLLLQQQDPGLSDPSSWKCVTDKQPEEGWLSELSFAMGAVRLLKSNAIAISKNAALFGMGTGQTSRIDALQQSIHKAGEAVKGAFLASDAFFPFDDCVRTAAAAGIVAMVQPGGSKRDDESIAACNEFGICMLLTERRHFRH